MLPASAMSSATFFDDIENEAGSRLHCLLSEGPCTSSTLIAADGVWNENALRRSLEECLTTGPPTEEYSVVSVFDAGATTDQLVSVTELLLVCKYSGYTNICVVESVQPYSQPLVFGGQSHLECVQFKTSFASRAEPVGCQMRVCSADATETPGIVIFDVKQNGLTCNATTRTASLALCVSDLVTITVKDNSEAAMNKFKCLLEVKSKVICM